MKIAEFAWSGLLKSSLEKSHDPIFNWLYDPTAPRRIFPSNLHRDLIRIITEGTPQEAEEIMRGGACDVRLAVDSECHETVPPGELAPQARTAGGLIYLYRILTIFKTSGPSPVKVPPVFVLQIAKSH